MHSNGILNDVLEVSTAEKLLKIRSLTATAIHNNATSRSQVLATLYIIPFYISKLVPERVQVRESQQV